MMRVPGETFSAEEAKQLVREARDRLETTFRKIDERTQHNLAKVLKAFREHRVGPHLFTPTDGSDYLLYLQPCSALTRTLATQIRARRHGERDSG